MVTSDVPMSRLVLLGGGVSSNPLLLFLGWVESHSVKGSPQTMTAHPRLHPRDEAEAKEELEAGLLSTMELSTDSRSLCALRALPARKFSRRRCFRCSETDTEEEAITIEWVGELVAKQGS